MTGPIAYQGEPGAFSHLALRAVFGAAPTLACATFEDAFAAVLDARAEAAVIPVENSVAGRVADVHHLLAESTLNIVAEHFEPVRLCLLASPGLALADIAAVRSHPMALAQCRRIIGVRGWRAIPDLDTAGAARFVADTQPPGQAALASALAGELHGLVVLAPDVQDDPRNTTRFLVLARAPSPPPREAGPAVTSLLFRVRNQPAALYKALGGFATNGVNITKLESYQVDGAFAASQFYCDIEGRPGDLPVARALEELQFFSSRLRIVGVYPAHPYRLSHAAAG